MFDGRGQARFAKNGGAQLLGGELAGAQNLEHNWALEERVVGQIDHAAATCAQLAENLVMFDGSSLHLHRVYRLGRQESLKSE
jgi:hypothetical protein